MRKLRKGTTVVEVVIAFAMISMSFAIGMIGIASGSNFLNSGAKLKNQQRKNAAVDLAGDAAETSDTTITVTYRDRTSSGDEKTKTFDVQRRSADNFIQYQPKP